MPVLILAGEEEFELSRRVAELKRTLLDPDWQAVNLLKLDKPALADVIDAAASLPFGPGNKLVLIERCEFFTRKRAKGGDDKEEESGAAKPKGGKAASKHPEVELAQALSVVAPQTYVVFACTYNFDESLKMSKAVLPHVKIEKFTKEKYWPGSKNEKLNSWCRREANLCGISIDEDAASYLLEGTEADLRAVSSEINKTASYIAPRKNITLSDVKEVSPYHSHVFLLADRWLSGRGLEALASAAELTSRQSAMPLIAALQTMLAGWIEMKALADRLNAASPSGPGVSRRELPLAELAKKLSFELKKHQFVIEKDLKRLSGTPTERLVEKKLQLTRLEYMIKTGQVAEAHALELFLTT